MRLLILGGTAWFSRQVAEYAVARGHDVVCAARGSSGGVAQRARLARVDRDDATALQSLADQQWDAVIDVSRRPSHVRRATAALGATTPYWLYVSSISVYTDHATPHQGVDAPTCDAARPDEDETNMERYGELKRACEIGVEEALGDRALIMRPGLIVGPGDPSGRFAYWPHHAAAGPELLVPGEPSDLVQLIDVRDLAAWTVTLLEQRITGVLNGIGPALPREVFVEGVIAGIGSRPKRTWVPDDFLVEQGVQAWMGDRSIPLWIPDKQWAGQMAYDPSAAFAAGLQVRPIADTARDTSAWLYENPGATVTGLTDTEHTAVLADWAARAD